MSFADTVANDFKITDATQTVTVKDAAGLTVATVQYADPHAISRREVVASDGFFQFTDLTWILGRNQLPATRQPLGGWSITAADGAVWELIADSTLDEFSISWVCITRKAR